MEAANYYYQKLSLLWLLSSKWWVKSCNTLLFCAKAITWNGIQYLYSRDVIYVQVIYDFYVSTLWLAGLVLIYGICNFNTYLLSNANRKYTLFLDERRPFILEFMRQIKWAILKHCAMSIKTKKKNQLFKSKILFDLTKLPSLLA